MPGSVGWGTMLRTRPESCAWKTTPLNWTSERVGPRLIQTPLVEAAESADSRTSVRPARSRSLRAICSMRKRASGENSPSSSARLAAARATASSASGESSPSCARARREQRSATRRRRVRTAADCTTRLDGPATLNFNRWAGAFVCPPSCGTLAGRRNDLSADLREGRLGRARRRDRAVARGLPLLERNGRERVDDGGIELCSRAAEDLRAGRLGAAGIAGGARGGDRLVGLGDGEERPGRHLARVGLLGAALVERGDEAVDEVAGALVDSALEGEVERFERRVLAVQERRHLLVVAAQVVLVDGAADDLQEVAMV